MNSVHPCTPRGFRKGTERGFSLTEVIISTAIFSVVMIGVMSLQSITARTTKDLYGPTRSRSARMAALNEIRYRLCDARINSCAFSTPAPDGTSYYRIRFQNPTMGGVTSEFEFDPTAKILYYDANIAASSPVAVARGPVEITFTDGSPDISDTEGKIVTLHVATSDDLAYSRVDSRDGDTAVYLRNPSS